MTRTRTPQKSHKNKHRLAFFLLSVLLAGVIVGTLLLSVSAIKNKMMDYSFSRLSETAQHLADDLYGSMETDRRMLRVMSVMIADGQEALAVLNAFDMTDSYVTDVELLLPDGRLLARDGTVLSAAGMLQFEDEVLKGENISAMSPGIINPDDFVVRNAVPVCQNGQALGVLYGVVSLTRLTEQFKTDIYDGKAYVYLVDGDTGQFMLDTWHQTLGNMSDFENRTVKSGYSMAEMNKRLQMGKSGLMAFVSHSTGRTLYMYYLPIGVNNWSVAVSVDDYSAFVESRDVNAALMTMAAVEGAALMLYMAAVVAYLMIANHTIKRLSREDAITRVQNRNAYEAREQASADITFATLACVYMDVNGLHELNNLRGHAAGDDMLCAVADCIRAFFPARDVYRLGGDEFVVICENADQATCGRLVDETLHAVQARGYSVSAGVAFRENERGVERVVREADAHMLKNKNEYYASRERDNR